MQLDGPVLDKVKIHFGENVDFSKYPFFLGVIKNLKDIVFPTQVTFFVGENGTGKSTILEAIATKTGFGREGGSKNINFNTADEIYQSQINQFSSALTLSWRKKSRDGYFFRAESFFNLANHIDDIAKSGGQGAYRAYESYGGKSLHEQSHGESFLSFFKNRLGGGGFYIFDEPEAALSPQRQLSLLKIIHDLCKNPESQFIIATHSPILLAYPNSVIYSCDGDKLQTIQYKDTKHYELTKGFLDNPDQYFKHLFSE
jgi:predicted ATPase